MGATRDSSFAPAIAIFLAPKETAPEDAGAAIAARAVTRARLGATIGVFAIIGADMRRAAITVVFTSTRAGNVSGDARSFPEPSSLSRFCVVPRGRHRDNT